MINLTAVREEALTRLKHEGSIPFTPLEGAYIGLLLFDAYESVDHPVISQANYEIDQMRIGKWEWLLAWLSPCHDLSKQPKAMEDIALFVLGQRQIPTEVEQGLIKLLRN